MNILKNKWFYSNIKGVQNPTHSKDSTILKSWPFIVQSLGYVFAIAQPLI